MTISLRTSRNFQTVKVLSIFAVLTGHYFQNIAILWVPVRIGLFIFAYSSAYFTTLKYGEEFDKKEYGLNKVSRVLTELIVLNVCLALFLILQGEEGIFCWQSILSFFGLTGLLHWLGLENPSPLGNGLWFLTLLWIFYFAYPFLVRLFRNNTTANIIMAGSLTGSYGLNEIIPMPYELFFTANAFIFGVYTAKTKNILPYRIGVSGLILSFAAMFLLNFIISFKNINYILTFLFAVSLISILEYADIYPMIHKIVGYFSDCILQLYIIHTYFFFHPTGQILSDFMISLLLICVLAKVLKIVCIKAGNPFNTIIRSDFSGREISMSEFRE